MPISKMSLKLYTTFDNLFELKIKSRSRIYRETSWNVLSIIIRNTYDQIIKYTLPGIQNSIRYLWKIFRKPTWTKTCEFPFVMMLMVGSSEKLPANRTLWAKRIIKKKLNIVVTLVIIHNTVPCTIRYLLVLDNTYQQIDN